MTGKILTVCVLKKTGRIFHKGTSFSAMVRILLYDIISRCSETVNHFSGTLKRGKLGHKANAS